MAGDLEKINEIFKIHDETKKGTKTVKAPEGEKQPKGSKRIKAADAVDRILIDAKGNETHNYTGDEISERDYHPIRQSREYHTGCLGGIMYFVFIVCVSIVLACVAWMTASDMLALNKGGHKATVTLPTSIFTSETVAELDEDGNKKGTKVVTHADIEYVASALKDAGIIEYRWLFEFFCKISNADLKLDAGEYELDSALDYRALVQHMQESSGAAAVVDVTIPEGFTMYQIFKRLEEEGVCSYDELMDAAANYTYNYSFLEGVETGEAKRLEGYLFPETYQFYVGSQGSSAINKFLNVFNNRQTADMLKQAENMGMSMLEIVTVASLIEKEAANDEERPQIASVIYNRLNAGMTLGLESTILYEFPEHEGAPTMEMLQLDNPYNTYVSMGLPPTPICNPGLASIQAALNPASTGYYYFTLDTETETHRFFTNINEFNNFVATQNYG